MIDDTRPSFYGVSYFLPVCLFEFNRHTFGDSRKCAICLLFTGIHLLTMCHTKGKCCDN
jgi:hypothetical protein